MSQKISELSKQLISLQNHFQESIQSFVKQFREAFKLSPESLEAIRQLWKTFEALPVAIKESWKKASEFGWYFNWETPLSSCIEVTKNGPEKLDSFMEMHLEYDWEKLTTKIIELCPDRSIILKEAFSLHNEGRYIASIPLFLSQTDGICAQYLGAFLFSEHPKRAEQIDSLPEKGESKSLDVFLSLLKDKNQYSKGIGQNSITHKEKGPNRNGILHGSRKHLDYGTKINSLKCFSLLSYTVFVLVDNMKKST
ncbi:hypothetical protein KQH27_00605 [bacterium]|nr:hypothetical protein [bacterium]